MLNTVILIGRLVRDPELRHTPNGIPVGNFTLAVDRPFQNKQGEQETDFIDIVVWRRLAETVAQHLQKGRLAAVEGRLQIRSYETQDGQKRRVAEIVANNVRFLDRPRDSGPQRAAEQRTDTDDFDPFADDDPNNDDVPF